MKKTGLKILFVFAFIIAGYLSSNAQEIGVRLGDVSAGKVAVDGIFSTGEFNRLHADLSFGNGVAADLLWDFFYRPLPGEAFNWYMGVGPYLAILDEKNHQTDENETNFNLGAAFEIGLEYHFNKVPLAIGLDYRPALEILDTTTLHWGGFGLNVRYVIN